MSEKKGPEDKFTFKHFYNTRFYNRNKLLEKRKTLNGLTVTSDGQTDKVLYRGRFAPNKTWNSSLFFHFSYALYLTRISRWEAWTTWCTTRTSTSWGCATSTETSATLSAIRGFKQRSSTGRRGLCSIWMRNIYTTDFLFHSVSVRLFLASSLTFWSVIPATCVQKNVAKQPHKRMITLTHRSSKHSLL